MARKYSKRMSKRSYSKRRSGKGKSKRRISRRRRTRSKGGANNCSLHPASITGSQTSSNTMSRPVAHHGETNEISNNPTYWSNYGKLGENVFGTLN